MKPAIVYLLLLSGSLRLHAQSPDSSLIGEYHVGMGLNLTLEVFVQDNRLMLEIVGQGTTTLKRLSPMNYEPEHIRPRATMVFLKDSTGQVNAIRFTQTNRAYTWKRISGDPSNYSGDFKLVDNPYRTLHVQEKEKVRS